MVDKQERTDDPTNEPYPPDPDDDVAEERPIPTEGRKITARAKARRGKGAITAPGKPKKKPKKGKTAQSRILAMERQRRAVELRKSGAQYHQIAEVLGYADASGARKAVERAMQRIPQESAMDMKALQIERCNHMLLTVWSQAQAGDLGAQSMALRWMQQLDVYTGAAQQAQQVDVNVTHQGGVLVVEGSKDDYISAMKRMAGVDGNGHNVQAAGAITQMPAAVQTGPDPVDVVVGEVMDDKPRNDAVVEPVSQVSGATPAFDFTMDPDVYRKD